GTTNFPSKKKLERGRIITWTRVLEFDPEVLWTPERFEAEFPAGTKAPNGSSGTAAPEETDIPADTLAAIQRPATGARGKLFWYIVMVRKEGGLTIDGTVALFEKYPDGVAAKYRGRLRHQVETVWAKLDKGENKNSATLANIVVLSQADFLSGFVPPDYLV